MRKNKVFLAICAILCVMLAMTACQPNGGNGLIIIGNQNGGNSHQRLTNEQLMEEINLPAIVSLITDGKVSDPPTGMEIKLDTGDSSERSIIPYSTNGEPLIEGEAVASYLVSFNGEGYTAGSLTITAGQLRVTFSSGTDGNSYEIDVVAQIVAHETDHERFSYSVDVQTTTAGTGIKGSFDGTMSVSATGEATFSGVTTVTLDITSTITINGSAVNASGAQGDGSQNNPYVFSTAEQLFAFAKGVNDGTIGADSHVVLDADIELGGTDQLFNCMVGKDLQTSFGKNTTQIVISMPILRGTDGVEKMSKSKGNYIALTDTPNEIKVIEDFCRKTESPVLSNHSGVIVSLTSFPPRIGQLLLVLRSILWQTCPPEKIVVWLSEEEFPNGLAELPERLTVLTANGVEFRFVPENIRGHKKYYYVFREYPDNKVITMDDDLIYPRDAIERLLALSYQYPKSVCGNVIRKIAKVGNRFLAYKEWEKVVAMSPEASNRNMAVGCGGICYPSRWYDDTLFDLQLIKIHSPFADDLWLKANELRLNVKVAGGGNFYPRPIELPGTQSNSLQRRNNGKSNLNDEQWAALNRIWKLDELDLEA